MVTMLLLTFPQAAGGCLHRWFRPFADTQRHLATVIGPFRNEVKWLWFAGFYDHSAWRHMFGVKSSSSNISDTGQDKSGFTGTALPFRNGAVCDNQLGRI